MDLLPTGTITFLLTDIEGSTGLWENDQSAMAQALARHNEFLARSVDVSEGFVLKTKGEGDSTFSVFARPVAAIKAGLDFQRALLSDEFPFRVRVAIHTGDAELRQGDYFGPVVNRCARLRSIAHGGQVLVSGITAELVRDSLPSGTSLQDLGPHRLKHLARPEHVFQLIHADLPAHFPPLRSLESFPNNLPVHLTSFVGRTREIKELSNTLATARLVTITGSGGSGKTRLAIRVAGNVLRRFLDGVFFVDLASVRDPRLVPQAVASGIGIREVPGKSISDSVLEFLKDRNLLLLLDNCEHLVAASAEFAERSLSYSSSLRILATSREALGLFGEVLWSIPSLSVPSPEHQPPPDQLIEYDAPRLFVDRAVAILPEFEPNDEEARAITQICRRLDGIPLAIELAAARLDVLTPEQIAERLDDRFKLLTGGSTTSPGRQKTLEATVDWSYQLLSQPDRSLLTRLSIFAGGCTLDAAEEVCSGGSVPRPEVLNIISSLVSKSLVNAERTAGGIRYGMLETIREYARERLIAAGVFDVLARSHRDWYLTMVERVQVERTGWHFAALVQEDDNVRSALEWSIALPDPEAAFRFCLALEPIWRGRGSYREMQSWVRRSLEIESESATALRALVLGVAGRCATQLGDYAGARVFHQEALDLARSMGDDMLIARSLRGLGWVALEEGDFATSRSLANESLTILRNHGTPLGTALLLNDLGEIARAEGDLGSAQDFYKEALAIHRETQDLQGASTTLSNLGSVAISLGELPTARESFIEALRIALDLEHEAQAVSNIQGLGGLAAIEGYPRRAVLLLAAADTFISSAGYTLNPPDRAAVDRWITSARSALEPAIFEALWAEGRATSFEDAVARALKGLRLEDHESTEGPPRRLSAPPDRER